MAKQKAMSVYIDDETALALNSLREEVRQRFDSEGLPGMAPTIGWLARSLLREKLGLANNKSDAPGAV